MGAFLRLSETYPKGRHAYSLQSSVRQGIIGFDTNCAFIPDFSDLNFYSFPTFLCYLSAQILISSVGPSSSTIHRLDLLHYGVYADCRVLSYSGYHFGMALTVI